MILQALADLYDRRAADSDSGIAPPGWEWKALPFLVEISLSGAFVQFVDTRQPQGKRLLAARFLVPKAVSRSVNIQANLLWDSIPYVLGIDPGSTRPTERTERAHQAFLAAIETRFGTAPADPGIAAVLQFAREVPVEDIRNDPLWQEVEAAAPFVAIRVAGSAVPVCSSAAVVSALADASPLGDSGGGARGVCSVTGRSQPIARLHPLIKGVFGAQSSGAAIVSFNNPSSESFGREQGANAPVGEMTAFAYTTALNGLLAPMSRQRALVADTTVVFWGERRGADALELALGSLFSEPRTDDPDAGTGAIAALYQAHRSGVAPVDDGGRFFVLGLAPNAARLAVRFWVVGTVREIGQRLVNHLDDLEIIRGPRDHEHPSLFRILSATAVLGKSDQVSPVLGGAVVQSILAGTPYPMSLLEGVIRRSRTERQVGHVRAATIKACLNRLIRLARLQMKEVTVSLDPTNRDPGYRLGRLFAVLERAQELSSPGLNATIRDRYYGAASTTPVTVFPRLLSLKNHHLAKVEGVGRRIVIERQIGEIMDGVAVIPAHLDLPEQGAFAVGYYHQRQSFFAPRPAASDPSDPSTDTETSEGDQE